MTVAGCTKLDKSTSHSTSSYQAVPETLLSSECHTQIDELVFHPTPSYQQVIEELLERSRLNQIPDSPLERSQMRSLIDKAHDELKHCDDSITQAEAMSAKLKEERLQITRQIDHASSLLSPIRMLPVEILGRIFELCVGDTVLMEVRTFFSSSSADSRPLSTIFTTRGHIFTLTWICSFWRRVVLSSSFLWSDITLSSRRLYTGVNRDSDATTDRELRVPASSSWITDCLSRSQSKPLRLAIFGSSVYSEHDRSDLFSQVLDAAVACSSRWGTLHLYCSETIIRCLRSRLENHTSSGTPVTGLLQDLSISATGSQEEVAQVLNILARTPCLRSLKNDFLRTPNQMDLSNLVILRIGRYVGPSLVALLAQCPSLQELDLSYVSLRDESSNTGALFHHKNLSVLHLYSNSTSDGNVFSLGTWRSIHLPALSRLSISTYGGIPDMDVLDEFNAMLLRSRCVLAEIRLTGQNSELWGNYITDISSGLGLGLVLDEVDAVMRSGELVYHRTDSTRSDV